MLQRTILVTGAAGFIGYHVCSRLLDEGYTVVGVDSLNDYYDVGLKVMRQNILLMHPRYTAVTCKVEEPNRLRNLFEKHKFSAVVHLAAQAGVRYSIDNPRAYLEANLIGTFELLEAARAFPPDHMLMASTSSVYGANAKMPYCETDKTDLPLSFYAATKKSNEAMTHSYAHLYDLPITMFRFFTVYVPWGRPDMALFKFTKAILNDEPIDVYNHGNMLRDFTYIDDLIEGIWRLIGKPPGHMQSDEMAENDSLSRVAPWRTINIGNSQPVLLMDFIRALEDALGKKAHLNLLEHQAGDVHSTWADTSLLRSLTDFVPQTKLEQGMQGFVNWYNSTYAQDHSDDQLLSKVRVG